MDNLPTAFCTLNLFKQFVLYSISPNESGKLLKRPADWRTGKVCDAHDSNNWAHAEDVILAAKRFGQGYGVGFVFTSSDPFFFIDIDGCIDGPNITPIAAELLKKFKGAAVEVSSSGKGIHIIGMAASMPHGCRNDENKLELYTEKRFVALTGYQAQGDVGQDCTQQLKETVEKYFSEVKVKDNQWWSTAPVQEWSGPEDDQELLKMMLSSKSVKAKFGKSPCFADLWENNEAVLSQYYPCDISSSDPYNRSSADAALAQHLAWWTGCNAERMLTLMKQSKLYRDKWDREDYLPRTIRAARGNSSGCLKTSYQGETSISSNFITAQEQGAYFQNCTYICEDNGILVPGGYILDRERFNVMMGGSTFVLDPNNTKTTNKAWDAFTLNSAVKHPKVQGSTFDPKIPYGTVIDKDGEKLVNIYWPYKCVRKKGDVTPFLNHLKLLWPCEHDRMIATSYLAALVQHLGYKFQWCPVIQGVQGNGKTFLSRVIAYCLGDRYVQMPRADEIASKFNDWLPFACGVVVEDFYFPDTGLEIMEVLKPMITNDRLMIEGKGKKKVMRQIYANFILNTNHKEALRKTRDDRRFAILYTAQQTLDDLIRDGMVDDYHPNLYNWAINRDGFAYTADYLYNFDIPDEFNPLYLPRAPITSTTEEAINQSLGRVEHEVLEAIESDRVGFKNGWISSTALDALLKDIGADKRVGRSKRRDLLKSLGYDWHPGLKEGRATTVMPGESGKPRLYIKDGHRDRKISEAQQIITAYKDSQK